MVMDECICEFFCKFVCFAARYFGCCFVYFRLFFIDSFLRIKT